MKTTLLVVGRTVEQHFITAINDYVQRTKRYLSFEMEVIPELKNTKSLSMEVQKEKMLVFRKYTSQNLYLNHSAIFSSGALKYNSTHFPFFHLRTKTLFP